MKARILILSLAALLGGTTLVSAQGWDNPPGYEWQRRGILNSQGQDPNGYSGYRNGYGSRTDNGRDAYGYVPNRYGFGGDWRRDGRNWRRDDPPGARFQNRGINEWIGKDPGNSWE